jgi:hypothetical protein
MAKPFDEPLPKREIDVAYDLLDQIDAMEELDVLECTILIASLRNLANTIEEALHAYAVRDYYAAKEDHVQGQIDHLRALNKLERADSASLMEELKHDGG